ncbi:MAG TPA: hypothetical protein VGJ88_02070 [Thermoanaerobaculia bacterium]
MRLTAVPGTKVAAPQVHAALEQIFKLNGCLACGLLGIDIHINGPDPDPLNVEGFNAQVR